jgi:hypothetical protein
MRWSHFTDRTAATLRGTMRVAALVQAGTVVVGIVMAWQAMECALVRHHGNSILCAFGVMLNLFSYRLSADTRERARIALDFSSWLAGQPPAHVRSWNDQKPANAGAVCAKKTRLLANRGLLDPARKELRCG